LPGYFIMGVVYAFAAAVQPGPFQAYLISQSLSHGWRRTILASSIKKSPSDLTLGRIGLTSGLSEEYCPESVCN